MTVRLPGMRQQSAILMAKLIYSGIVSLDGYIADQAGKFDWSAPDEEVHSVFEDFAEIWRTTDKVVYPTLLACVLTARTWIEAGFHPDAVRRKKANATREIRVGGPTIAAEAIRTIRRSCSRRSWRCLPARSGDPVGSHGATIDGTIELAGRRPTL